MSRTPPQTPDRDRDRRPRLRAAARSALLLALLMAALLGCRRPAPSAPLRIAVLPILDSLPLYVAAAEGYFANAGVAVELLPAASAAERDQLLQAGQIDGMVTDLVALALYNRETPQAVAVRYAMVPTAAFPQFRILASGAADIRSVADLRNVPIGVSEGTVIEYVTERILSAEGLGAGEITTLAVPRIPERMALLDSGDLQAATLPEPLGTLALQQGAVVIADDTAYPEVSASIFAFTTAATETRPDDVRAFLRAVDQASAAINANKAAWADLLTEQELVPPPLEGAYTLPDYPTGGVPSAAQFADVVAWLNAEGHLDGAPDYEAAVSAAFLE